MPGLPDRTGDPKDSKFGRPSPHNPPANGFTPVKEASEPDNETPFAEYVACFLCHAPLSNAEQEGRSFWITSCNHVLCSRHDNEDGRCTLCGETGITAHILNKDLPQDLRDFLRTGTQLLDNVENASNLATRAARALKASLVNTLAMSKLISQYQNDQLMRTVGHISKQLHLARERASVVKGMLEATNVEKSGWDGERSALQAEIAELRGIIAANDRGLAAFVPNASAGVMPTIAEEGRSMDGSSLGKRMREESSPGPHKSVDRITMAPMQSSSTGSYSSPRSMGQIKTNLGQFRYNPSPAPQMPMTPYRSQSVAPPNNGVTPRMVPPMQQYLQMSTPAPNNIVARLRQNGRSERDDSSSRPATAQGMSYQQSFQTPMTNGGRGSPYPTHGPTYHDEARPRYQGPSVTPRPYLGSRF